MTEYKKWPFEPEVLCVVKSGDYVACEQYFHEVFSEKNIRGEWFDLDDEDIEAVKNGEYDHP